MPTGAMIPTIEENGYVVADTSESQRAAIKRWDMVVFRAPDPIRLYGVDPAALPEYVMRIAGLPGESIDFGGDSILIDGKEISLPASLNGVNYSGISSFPPRARRMDGPARVRLGSNEFFILGDRTATAIDSRFFGPLPKSNVVGRVTRVE